MGTPVLVTTFPLILEKFPLCCFFVPMMGIKGKSLQWGMRKKNDEGFNHSTLSKTKYKILARDTFKPNSYF